MKEASQARLACAGIAAGAIAAYAGSFAGPFVFDDGPSIVDNPTIRRLGDLGSVLAPPPGGYTVSGRPLVNLSLALNRALGGQDVWGYHAVNLLIHILAGLALFGIGRRTLAGARAWRDRALPLAFAAALIWTLHPLQTEAVSYIVQRAESLMGLFYLLTLYFFIRYTEADSNGILTGRPGRETLGPSDYSHPSEHSHSGALPDLPAKKNSSTTAASRPSCKNALVFSVLSIVCCFLGMAAKEVMVSAPVIVLLYDRTFIAGSFAAAWRRRRGYYAALALAWLPLAAFVAASGGRGASAGAHAGMSLAGYWLTQVRAVACYLRLAAWPHPLVFDYGTSLIPYALPAVPEFLLLAVLAALCVWRLSAFSYGGGAARPETLSSPPELRIGQASRDEPLHHRQPLSAAAAFCGLFFFAVLAPTALVPVVTEVMAEHRMYLALAPLAALAVAGSSRLLPARPHLALCLAAAAALGCATAARNRDYRSQLALWSRTAADAPLNARAVYNQGLALAAEGNLPAALKYYRRAIDLDPGYTEARNNLGIVLAGTGRWNEAAAEYEKAMQLDPASGRVRYNLGNAYLHLGRTAEAISAYEDARRLSPGDAAIDFNLGLALAKQGRLEEAIPAYERASQLDPQMAKADYNLADACLRTGRLDEAAEAADACLRLQPENADAHYLLATALVGSGRIAEAVGSYEAAIRIRPGDADIHADLGAALAELGRFAEARAELERAVALGDSDARSNLAHLPAGQ